MHSASAQSGVDTLFRRKHLRHDARDSVIGILPRSDVKVDGAGPSGSGPQKYEMAQNGSSRSPRSKTSRDPQMGLSSSSPLSSSCSLRRRISRDPTSRP